MSNTRLSLRTTLRQELGDTVATYLWPDTQLHDALSAGFQAYSEWWPNRLAASSTSTANQTAVTLASYPLVVYAITVDGVTVARVPDESVLYEPALRNQVAQSAVQPLDSYGAAASHGQAWALVGGSVPTFRYGLAAGRAIVVYYGAPHVLPSDDVTAVTVPDVDVELPILFAADRLVRAFHTDAIKRGAAGSVAGSFDDRGYRSRYDAAVRLRRGKVRMGLMPIIA